jgi:hypothetical protein
MDFRDTATAVTTAIVAATTDAPDTATDEPAMLDTQPPTLEEFIAATLAEPPEEVMLAERPEADSAEALM